jgi:hypothetical protein
VNAFDRLAATPPTISTKAELLQRLTVRPSPSPERICEPRDADAADLKRLSVLSNEERIARLRASLKRSSALLQHDQAQARLSGYARAQFERER